MHQSREIRAGLEVGLPLVLPTLPVGSPSVFLPSR